MRPPHTRRHHPLAAAGTVLEQLVLRHFGFQLTRPETKDPPPAQKPPAGLLEP